MGIGSWATLENLYKTIGLTYFVVGMNTEGLGDSIFAFKTESSERNQESYITTRLCITRSTQEER